MLTFGGWRRRTVAHAERRLRTHPSPGAYLDLARAHLDRGIGERALEVLRRGREAFPDAVDLAALYDEICWSHVRQRAGELQARIDYDPRPSDVVALARLFVQVGDLTRAIDTLKRGVDQFADDVQVNLEMARLRLRLWHRDLLAADGLDAAERLDSVLDVDEQHVEALVLAAELRAQVGAFEEALGFLERLAALKRKVLDDATRERLDALAEAARQRLTAQTEHADDDEPAKRDLETRLEAVETSRRPVVNLDDLTGAPADAGVDGETGDATRGLVSPVVPERDVILTEASRLAAQPAVRACLVLEQGDELQTLGFFGREAESAVESALAEIVATASQACERIQIGRLKEASVCCRTGTAAVAGLGDPASPARRHREVVAVLCDAAWRPREAEERLTALVARLSRVEELEPQMDADDDKPAKPVDDDEPAKPADDDEPAKPEGAEP